MRGSGATDSGDGRRRWSHYAGLREGVRGTQARRLCLSTTLASKFNLWLMSTGPCCAVTYIFMISYTIRVDVDRTPLRGNLQFHDLRVHSAEREMCVTAKCSSSQEGVMK